MQIQVNSDNHIESSIRLEEWVRTTIESTLERYEEDLTRVEVYLRDENGDKPGPHDLSCRLEARPKGHQPLSVSAKGDTLVITYSGHGTWVPDQNGDEPDGRDEALCPWDIGAGKVLLDDEIGALFAHRAAGVRVLLISDSCHSGSVTRGDDSDLDPGMPRARFLPPSVWMKADELPASRVSSLPIISGMSRSGGDLLMAGCLDTQFSWDTRFKGRPNGAFTYYALKTLATLPAGATYADWFKAITPTYLPTNQLPQNPQLFGSRTARAWKVFA